MSSAALVLTSVYLSPIMANFETVEAEIKDVAGTPVRVATPMALYRIKKATLRPQDHVDEPC